MAFASFQLSLPATRLPPRNRLSVGFTTVPPTPVVASAGWALTTERVTKRPEDAKVSVYSNERPSGSFRRAVSLPDDVDPARVNATYRDGVLHVSIARRESAQPRRITVQ